jgi:CO dehydrogenase/acetyl-CoA synthase delta subunit
MLLLNRRQIRDESAGLQFKTPDQWAGDLGIRSHYTQVVFERSLLGDLSNQVMGVGHKVFGKALDQAKQIVASVAVLPNEVLQTHHVVFKITDQITEEKRTIKSIWAAVSVPLVLGDKCELLKDEEALELLNRISEVGAVRRGEAAGPVRENVDVDRVLTQANEFLRDHLDSLKLPFKLPLFQPFALLLTE